MPTSHFDPALLPPARTFYEQEIGRLTRPSRGWAQGKCPFHDSRSGRSFAVNLTDGGFYCFGCSAKGGDVVDFLRLRYRLDFKSAAQEAGAWREDMPSERSRKIQAQRERESEAQARKEAEALQGKIGRLQARKELEAARQFYDEHNSRLTELRRGAPERFPGEIERCWELLPLALESERMDESAYCLAAGMADPYLYV